MRKLQCQTCNSVLNWDGVEEIITCPACGMRYQMFQRTPEERKKAAAQKGNCVAPRPMKHGSDIGKVYYNSWLPEGWDYDVDSDQEIFRHGASASTPFCPYILLVSPDRTAHMKHYTTNGYVDPGPRGMPNTAVNMSFITGRPGTPMTPTGDVSFAGKDPMMGGAQSNDPSSLGMPSFTRWRIITTAAEYCDEIAVLDGYLSNLELGRTQTEMDDVAKARIEQVKNAIPDAAATQIHWDWCRKLYRGTHNGAEYTMICEAQIASSGFDVEEAQMAAERQAQRAQTPQQNNGGFLAGVFNAIGEGLSQMVAPTSNLPRWWQTDYEAVFVCPTEQFETLYPHYLKFISTLELGEDFRATEEMIRNHLQQVAMQVQGTIANAQMNIAAQNAASWERKNAIIQDKNEYTNNIMHDMMASNAASHDRVANMHSEMIGGYNVYQGADGNLVRADTAFDHVYQGTGQMSDWLVGTEGGWLEPGTDFVPLDQIKGGNY